MWVTCFLCSTGITRFLATTKQCAPDQCIGTFGLVGRPLVPFPFHHRPGSQVPYESPNKSHASSTPDPAWPVSRYLPCSSRNKVETPVLVSSNMFRCLVRGSFALISLIHT